MYNCKSFCFYVKRTIPRLWSLLLIAKYQTEGFECWYANPCSMHNVLNMFPSTKDLLVFFYHTHHYHYYHHYILLVLYEEWILSYDTETRWKNNNCRLANIETMKNLSRNNIHKTEWTHEYYRLPKLNEPT